jgi:chromosome segregation ATPase
MDGNVTFRSAVMGGFNREDVMNYIERTANEHRAEMEQLVQTHGQAVEELEHLRAENASLQEQTEEQQHTIEAQLSEIQVMAAEHEELRQEADRAKRLSQELAMTKDELDGTRSHADSQQTEMLVQLNRLKAEKSEMEQVMAQAKERLEEQSARLSEQEHLIRELQGQTTAMKQNSTAYQDLCGRIGQIEMDMRFRTLRMEQETKETMQAQAEAARATYEKVVASANEDAVEVRRQAQEQLELFQDDISGTSAQVSEAVSQALEQVNAVKAMLERLDANLGERLSAVNAIQLGEAETRSFTTKVVAQAEEDVAAMESEE